MLLEIEVLENKLRVLIRFETESGEKNTGWFYHFKLVGKKFYAFTHILGYSIMLYATF